MQILPEPLITQDQINLLKYDNIKTEKGTSNFDIGCPSKLKFEDTVMKYAFNWTEGGQFSNAEKIKNLSMIIIIYILIFCNISICFFYRF